MTPHLSDQGKQEATVDSRGRFDLDAYQRQMRELGATIAKGERFRHLNTGHVYVVDRHDTDGRVRIGRSGTGTRVWPDYLLNPANFERLGPPVVLP